MLVLGALPASVRHEWTHVCGQRSAFAQSVTSCLLR
jgi:hypothetical protein